MLTKKKLNLHGLHCANCKTLIESEVDLLKGVKEAKVDLRKNILDLEYDKEKVDLGHIVKEIEKLGYKATDGPELNQRKSGFKQWFYSLVIVIALYLAYRILDYIGILSWLELDQNKMGYGVAFLVGIVASLSTCLMVVGAVIISFSAKYQTKGNFYKRNVEPHLYFQIGRIITFFILGGVLGLIGNVFSLSNVFMGWFTVVISLILVWLALSIMQILPSMTKFGIGMPQKVVTKWNKLKNSEHMLAPVLLGGLTFFLPCGFTQSMQLFAMASGNFLTGGLTLMMFALGTSPVLIGLGVASNRFRNKKSDLFFRVVGMILIVFAVYIMSNGLALAGYNVGSLASKKLGEAKVEKDVQIIEMSVNYRGFEPNVFKLKSGVRTRWIINGDQLTGCTNKIIVPDLNIEKALEPGENIIEFIPAKAGTINFSCWMGMVRGKFIVSGDGENVSSEENSSVYIPQSTCSGGGSCGGTCGQTTCGCSQ